MRGLLLKGLAGSGLLVMGLSANAQTYGQGPYRQDPYQGPQGQYQDRNDDRYYQQDDGRYRDDRGYYPQARPRYRNGNGYGSPVQQALADLDYAQSNGYLSRGDRGRFNKAREELVEFQRKLDRGRFDRHELDDAIGALNRVVSHERGYDGRSPLWDDLQRLREFRDSYQYQGGGYGRYGYPRY